MSKIAVVYWTSSGNTQEMANAVVEGVTQAGSEAELIFCSDFNASKVADYDAIAFGCSAMGAEELDPDQFEPMFADVESSLSGKKIALFGSYGWGTGEWMDAWAERANAAGANVVKTVIANEAPDDAAKEECRSLGAALV